MKLKDIIMIQGSGCYSHIFLNGQKAVITSKVLGHFAKTSDDDMFFRTLQSNIVNFGCVQ